METLVKEVIVLRRKCKHYGNHIDSIIEKPLPSDPRSGCFGMIFNSSTLTLELLSHYYELWKKPHHVATEEDLRRSREENAQRCIEITKMQFVLSMSNIEFCVKETINLYPKHLLAEWCREQEQKKRRIYLRGIIENSKSLGLVDEKDYECWDCILEVRNTVVHNNGIADYDKTCQVDRMTVSFVRGKMLRGKLDFFVKLTDKATELCHSWTVKLLEEQQRLS